MTESDVSAAIADLRARVTELEKLPSRVAGLEKALWGFGGVVGAVSYFIGVSSDNIRKLIGGE